jgi:hypothetical protein
MVVCCLVGLPYSGIKDIIKIIKNKKIQTKHRNYNSSVFFQKFLDSPIDHYKSLILSLSRDFHEDKNICQNYHYKNQEKPKTTFATNNIAVIECCGELFNFLATNLYRGVEKSDIVEPTYEADIYIFVQADIATIYERCRQSKKIDNPFSHIFISEPDMDYSTCEIWSKDQTSLAHFRKVDRLMREYLSTKKDVYYINGNSGNYNKIAEIIIYIASTLFYPKYLDSMTK